MPDSATSSTRPPLERMHLIHEAVSSGKYPNCETFRQLLLERFGSPITRRTLLRDIEFMQTRLGLPLEYVIAHRGYAYTQPVTHFPMMQISEGELMALCVARQALESYRGTSFENSLRTAFEKLVGQLGDSISVNFGDLTSVISFRNAGFSPLTDLGHFETVSRAVLRSEELLVEYVQLRNPGETETKRLRPLHITSVENAWYLFANTPSRTEAHTYALSRMRSVRATGVLFTRDPSFDPAAYLAHSFGIFGGGKPETVRLRFTPFATRLVEERRWHPSQTLRRLKAGGSEMSLKVSLSPDLRRWVLGWGPDVEVLAPASLRREVRASLQASLQYYDE